MKSNTIIVLICMCLFSACATQKSTIPIEKVNSGISMSNDIIYGEDTFVVKQAYSEIGCFTKNYDDECKSLRQINDSVYSITSSKYSWYDVWRNMRKNIAFSNETLVMILRAGGVDSILRTILSEESYNNTLCYNNEPRFEVYYIMSLQNKNMHILEYGFNLSWKNDGLQLKSEEIKGLLNLMFQLQLIYSGDANSDIVFDFGFDLVDYMAKYRLEQ